MIIKMKKISLKGPKEKLRATIDALKYTASFEVKTLKRAKKELSEVTETTAREDFATLLARINNALNFSQKSKKELTISLKRQKQMSKGNVTINKSLDTNHKQDSPEISYSELKNLEKYETDVLETLSLIEDVSIKIAETRTLIERNKSTITDLKPYINLDIDFNILRDTRETFVLAGIIPATTLEKFKSDFDLNSVVIQEFPATTDTTCLVCIGHSEDYPIINSIYDYEFERCKFNFNVTAKEKIVSLEEQNANLTNDNLSNLQKACLSNDKISLLKQYYDYINNELNTEELISSTLQTENFFILNGWIVESEETRVIQAIQEVSNKIQIKTDSPADKDSPPVLLKNSRLVAPYASITNIYGAPSRNDIDPNLFVAFFYFLFFGVMMGDIGYGILIFTIALIVLIYFKPKHGAKDLIAIICMGGISTIIWGILFGSFFGEKTGASGLLGILPPGQIDPIENPLVFLGLTLGLGVLHLMFGIALKFYNLSRQGKVIDAFLDAGVRLTLFSGLIMFVLSILSKDNFANLATPGIYIAVGSVALIALTAGRKNKSIFGKISGGFGGIYSLVNYLTDILSYARLFGLGLVGSVIGMVANIMGGMVMGIPFIGIPLGILIALLFHAFNLSIGLLSAYVHNARLQFIEFFGKFYDGNGKMFSPLGSNMKYVTIKSENNIRR